MYTTPLHRILTGNWLPYGEAGYDWLELYEGAGLIHWLELYVWAGLIHSYKL